MLVQDIKITTGNLLEGALVFAILDILYLLLLNRLIKPDIFSRIKWLGVSATALVWFCIWKWVLAVFWESVYRYVFPLWARNWIPFAFGLLMAVISLVFWTLAVKNTHAPLVAFCLLGGAWGIITHTWAIYRGIMTKPPMLQGASPLAALLIAFFEYIFYWCTITALASIVFIIWRRMSGKGSKPFSSPQL